MPFVINFDENIKKNFVECVWNDAKWKEEFEFFRAIIIDNYLVCGWGMENTAVVKSEDGRIKLC